MDTGIGRFFGLADRHRLLPIAAAVIFGGIAVSLLNAPHSEKDLTAAIHRVYGLQAQPLVCQPARMPPTR